MYYKLVGFYNRGGKCLLHGTDSPFIKHIMFCLQKVNCIGLDHFHIKL